MDKLKWLLDERLLQTQKLAAIGEMATGIAHEINNPLAIIRQEAEWLTQLLKNEHFVEVPEAEDFRDSLREIIRQVERCKEITHNLLNLARKHRPVIQEINLKKLIADIAALVEKEASKHDIEVRLIFQPNLPTIYSDPPLLRQVLLNLLTNAAHAIGKQGTITITAQLGEPGWVEIKVRDTGSGIPPEKLNKIFDPFFTTKPPGKGTGLGLAISQAIITKLGGAIAATSRPDRGTTFTISLPENPKKESADHAG